MVTEKQKLILLADKSEFGWKTVQEYTQHELADSEADGKKIRRAEERAEKAFKSAAAKKSAKRRPFLRSYRSQFCSQDYGGSSAFSATRNQRDRHSFLVRLGHQQDLEVASLAENLAIGGPNVHRFLVLVRNLQQVSID